MVSSCVTCVSALVLVLRAATIITVSHTGPLLQFCTSDSECQYEACTTFPGPTVTPKQAKCKMNDEYDDICQRRWDYWLTGEFSFTLEVVWEPCPLAPCAAGKYKSVDDTCVPCPAGYYQRLTGMGSCDACEPGKYQELSGQTRCSACAVGTYATANGSNSSQVCTRCAEGTYASSALGSTACLECGNTVPEPFSSMDWYYLTECNASQDYTWRQCTECADAAGACTPWADTQCGGVNCTSELLGAQPEYAEWMSAEYKCSAGQYLRGFTSAEDKDCRQCPEGMVGRNGQYCEWCAGPLEEPYWLDQSVCVCKTSAVMNSTGQCVCPDGRQFAQGKQICEECPVNTYGSGGSCYECTPGWVTQNNSATGATVCSTCAAGKYRLAGQSVCSDCNETGYYAPDPSVDLCVACNLSCAGIPGWHEVGVCPGSGGALGYKLCAPCDLTLPPSNAKWIIGDSGGGCVYACDAGFYLNVSTGGCMACSTVPCPAGYMWRDCTADADRTCEEGCTNESKPIFHSKWAQAAASKAGSPGTSTMQCPWECEDGYEAVETDYWMFSIHECVAN
jgi:hypothetical protein